MQGGFNTNIRYQGRTFHVQTEDSGHANPKIVTLLYEGGVILTSKKTSYEDKVSADNLESVVRELMEEQHRVMVQSLKDGDLDEVIGGKAQGKGKGKGKAKGGKAPQRQVQQAFGEGVVGDRSLDEVILSHLTS